MNLDALHSVGEELRGSGARNPVFTANQQFYAARELERHYEHIEQRCRRLYASLVK